jgi:hypothetical protein
MPTSKITSIVLYVLMGVSVILAGWFFFGGYVEGTKGTNIAEPNNTAWILIWAVVLFVIAALVALIFPAVFYIMNPKHIVRNLIFLGVIAVVIFVSYQLASDEILDLVNYNGPDNVPGTLRLADTGLFITYLLGAAAFLLIIISEIYRAFK